MLPMLRLASNHLHPNCAAEPRAKAIPIQAPSRAGKSSVRPSRRALYLLRRPPPPRKPLANSECGGSEDLSSLQESPEARLRQELPASSLPQSAPVDTTCFALI